ncbi:MAG: hypothetical protein ABW321_21490, partial [Polyangiales bacterium]
MTEVKRQKARPIGTRTLGASALLISLAGACGGAESAPEPNPATPTTPSAAAGSSAQAPTVGAPSTPGQTPGAQVPGATPTPPSTGVATPTPNTPAAPSGAGGSAAPTTPATPTEAPVTMGGPEARFPDACTERRASWSVPCTQNPDPCNLKSGYDGDQYCLVPPPEGKGIQIHFGPKNYQDKAEVEKYLIQPGQEFNSYAFADIPTTEEKFYAYVKISMRPGSHHLINNVVAGKHPEGFTEGVGCEGSSIGSFPGTQNLITESPPQGIPAPENEGIGRALPGGASLCQNYHRYNNTDTAKLNEIWYNVWFVEEKDITQKANGVNVTAGPWTPIPAHSEKVLTTTGTASGDGRIISLFGHRHAATERFAAWLNDELIYDSHDWVESRVFNYDSITQNPPIATDTTTDGAVSGVLEVKNGDKVKIECHVNNTTDQPLRFANELYTGEMCIL